MNTDTKSTTASGVKATKRSSYITTTNPKTNKANNIPEAYLETLKHKPFRFGDYYYLQEPPTELKDQMDSTSASLAETLSHIFNRTHQSRYTVFPTLYQQFKQMLNYMDSITFNQPANENADNSYFITLLFRESKLVGFRYISSEAVSGIYFMSYYNARIDLRPITHTFIIKREHLVSLIDILDEYNQAGFVIRTNYTRQPIKKID
jgi:hypothetical protein